MVIIGFPAIGKSSYQKDQARFTTWEGPRCIDLESSDFVKCPNWEVSYANTAIDLTNQGFDVFCSSHKLVREALLKKKEDGELDKLFIIYPSIIVYDAWLTRCKNRYYTTKLEKDSRSLARVQNFFQADVMELDEEVKAGKYTDAYVIDGPYSLNRIIGEFRKK